MIVLMAYINIRIKDIRLLVWCSFRPWFYINSRKEHIKSFCNLQDDYSFVYTKRVAKYFQKSSGMGGIGHFEI